MWITNGSIADVAIVWAKTEEGIRGFVVPTDTPGFATQDIHHKLSLRASVTSELLLEDVRLPESAVLPGISGMGGPLKTLGEARLGIVFGASGAARACLEAAVDYARTRVQFGQPIGAFQLTQGKLADMAGRVAAAQMLALRLGRMKDAGTLRPEHVSLGKHQNVASALEVARTARTILGANGITLEYPVMRHAANLETVLTYEGTHEVHALVLGRALTGLAAFG
jgi:glutaryl-CoA dehydrogenase